MNPRIVYTPPPTPGPSLHIGRAAVAAGLSQLSGRPLEETYRATFGADAVGLTIARAALDPMATDDHAALARTELATFLDGLAPQSAAATVLGRVPRFNLNGRSSIELPSTDEGAVASWVSELELIPVREVAFASEALAERKLGALVLASWELLKRTNADAILRILLEQAAAKLLDETMFDETAGDATRPAGLLNGVTPIPGYAGGDPISARTDVRALVAALAPVAGGRYALVMRPDRAVMLAEMLPAFTGTVIVSGHIPDIVVGLALPALGASTGALEIETSRHATLHMSDEPLPIVEPGSPATTADPVRSTFQTASAAVRLVLDIGWAKRSAAAVAWVEDPSW